MSDQPTKSEQPKPQPKPKPKPKKPAQVHEVKFVTYPKLLFIWPLILAGFVLYPFGKSAAPAAPATVAAEQAELSPVSGELSATQPAAGFDRLGTLGWIYIWVAIIVLLTLGVNINRNQFVIWLIVIVAFWILGLWLKDVKNITIIGDIYRWFVWLDVKYDRALGLSLSVLLLIPYVIMLLWARLDDRWRITHNEFEHYSFGKMDDSLGRGAKSIRSSFPDVLELFLGLAGTLVIYNATGTKELRRIPHVMFLPLIRSRLNLILEKTAITGMMAADEEEDDEEDM